MWEFVVPEEDMWQPVLLFGSKDTFWNGSRPVIVGGGVVSKDGIAGARATVVNLGARGLELHRGDSTSSSTCCWGRFRVWNGTEALRRNAEDQTKEELAIAGNLRIQARAFEMMYHKRNLRAQLMPRDPFINFQDWTTLNSLLSSKTKRSSWENGAGLFCIYRSRIEGVMCLSTALLRSTLIAF